MFSIIGDGIVVESAILEKDVQFMMEDVKARGYDKVESRPMGGIAPVFRSVEEIAEEKNWAKVEA